MPPSARVSGVPVLDNESACHGSPQPPPRRVSSAPAQRSRQRHTRPIWDHFGTTRYARWRTTCASVNAMPHEKLPRETADQRERVTAIYSGSSGLVAASETAWVHRNTVTGKSVVVYSTPMSRNGPELPGSGRSRRTTNHLVTQQTIRNNRTYPDLWVGNPLVAGSSPARPTLKGLVRADLDY
jgi:hypothetical protein